jgi:hypothetical protein
MALRNYQEECIEQWEACDGDKFLVDIFCGLGKSRLIIEMLLRTEGHRIVVMSNLSLVNQFCKGELTTLKRLKKNKYMVFCTLGETSEVETATTAIEDAQRFLRTNKNGVVAVTYHSLEKLMEAFEGTALLFCDESHNVNSPSNRWISTSETFEKIVYLSATPGEVEQEVEAFTYSYADALENCDEDGVEYPWSQDVRVHVGSTTATSDDDSVLGLLVKTALETENMRVLTFSNTVRGESETSVNNFKGHCDRDVERLVRAHPKGRFVKKVTVLSMDGFTPQADRDHMLKTLDETPDDELCILCSCQTISEGVNTKKCNMVAFIDPVRCWQLIVQRMGRAVRLQEGRPPATILIPCFVDMAEVQALSSPEERDAYVRTHYAAGNPMFDFLAAIREGCPDLLAQLVDMYKGPQSDRLSHYKELLGDLPERLTLDEAVERVTGIKTTDVKTAARTSSRSIDVHRREAPVEQCEGAAAIEASIVEMEPDRFVVARGAVPAAPRKNRLVFDSISPFLQSIRFDEAMGTAVVEYELRPEHFEQRIAQLHVFYTKYGEPKRGGVHENERSLACWIQNRRQDKKKGKNSELCHRIHSEFSWWSWDPFVDEHEKTIQDLHAFYAKFGRPKEGGVRQTEDSLARWISKRRRDKRKGKNVELCARIHSEFSWWSWDPFVDELEKKIQGLHVFYAKYGEPKRGGVRENERSLACWIQNRRRDKKKGENSELCDRINSEFSWWSWDPFVDEHEKTIQHLHAFYAKFGKPKQDGLREKEDFLARWICQRRIDKKKGKNSELCARIHSEFSWWSWDPLVDEHENTIQHLHAFYAKFGKPKQDGVREKEKFLARWICQRRIDKRKEKKIELCDRCEVQFPWMFEGLSDSVSETSDPGRVMVNESKSSNASSEVACQSGQSDEMTEEFFSVSEDSWSTVDKPDEADHPREKRSRDDEEPRYAWRKICKRGYTAPNEVDKDEINDLFASNLPSGRGIVIFLDHVDFRTAKACVAAGVQPGDMVIPQMDEAAFQQMRQDPTFGPSVVFGDFNTVVCSFQGRTVPIRGIYADFTGALQCGLDFVAACNGAALLSGAIVAVTITLRNPKGNDLFTNSAIETLSSAMADELHLVSVRNEDGDRIPPLTYGNGAPMATILKKKRAL